MDLTPKMPELPKLSLAMPKLPNLKDPTLGMRKLQGFQGILQGPMGKWAPKINTKWANGKMK